MDKHYLPHAIEKQCYQRWEQAGYFKAGTPTTATDSAKNDQSAYCIMLPPPNVTGSLHMGHGFQHTLMDALIRYQRMSGKKTLWQAGTDHAGIATQMVVERQLNEKNTSRQDLGREAFLDKVWQWKEESGNTISQQLRRMGSSLDWSRECFTMDAHFSCAVIDVFVKLHDEGLIYRGQKLVNWDVKFHTAVSDLEVVSHPEKGTLWYFRYPIDGCDESITIATTRPETMLGDTAVAVHPEDERYQTLIGQNIRLPLTDRLIPIIADAEVDPTFGTGCVKITPAHDFNDYAMAKRHDLPMINILNGDATLNDNAPLPYRGMDRFVARTAIIGDLKALNLFVKEEPHDMNVPRGDRSHEIIEPMLTFQWFVKAKPLAEPALEAVRQGEIKFVPDNWSKTYYQWLENIEDWCISRQLWWGHRIPAWYDDAGNIYVGRNEKDVRAKNKLTDSVTLRQDNDVLDTWFSAALWPFATLGWPENTEEYQTYFPTSVLITGFDIIFFWVARMIMMSLKFTGKIPFHEVYITGLIRDSHGQKMSKSKGNVLDPIDLIDGISLDDLIAKRTTGMMQPKMAKQITLATTKEFPEGIATNGTDAVRFTFCALAGPGRDIRFDMSRLEGYHFFCNKIWNATRYVLQRTEGFQPSVVDKSALSIADRWILSQLQTVVAKSHDYYRTYRFDLLAHSLYEFTWNEFCDWYLELSKPVLMNEDTPESARHATQWTLLHVLETLMRVMHPIMPYITEEIWQRTKSQCGVEGDSVMLQAYPQAECDWEDALAVADVEWLKAFVVGIRTIRSEMNISPALKLSVLLCKGNANDRTRVQQYTPLLQFLAKCEKFTWLEHAQSAPPAATALAGELEILIPLAGSVDPKAEQARLERELQKLNAEITKAQQKLDNPNYTSKAPQEVVAQERERLASFTEQVQSLTEKLQLLVQCENTVD